MVSDVLLLSYLDKIGLSLTGEAGQASAYLYSACAWELVAGLLRPRLFLLASCAKLKLAAQE